MGIVVGHHAIFPRKPSRRGKKTPFGEKLRSLTGPVYALRVSRSAPRMTNKTYVNHLNNRGRTFTEGWRVPYYLIDGHLAGRNRLLVSAKWGLFTLLYVDLDTHKRGRTADVEILAQVVRQHFPGMPEFVVNERGGSGWLVVDTSSFSPAEYNALLDRLQDYFRSLAKAMSLDIEHVEIKGRLYVHHLKDGWCQYVEAGDLLKCPPAEHWLDQAPVDALRFAGAEFDPWQAETQDQSSSLRSDESPRPEAAGGTSAVTGGSFHPQLLSQEAIGRLPALERWVENQFPDRPTQVDDRAISARQFAELLIALAVLPPNQDKSNPYKRHEAFVQEMYRQGVFASAYNHHKYKAVRDYLSAQGLVEWTDHTYRPGAAGQDGRACKWSLDAGLVDAVLHVLALKAGVNQGGCVLSFPPENRHQHRVPRPVWTLDSVSQEDDERVMALFEARVPVPLAA